MSAKLVLPAPAKINLFLHIIGRREDGYHLLQSVFQFLDYGDEISFSVNDSGALSLTSNIPELNNSDNLIVKAAKLLQQKIFRCAWCQYSSDQTPANGRRCWRWQFRCGYNHAGTERALEPEFVDG